MQKGFTLLELLITIAIMAVAATAIALAMPTADARQAEQEAARLQWVVSQAHDTAQRYRKTLSIVRVPNGNGYQVLNVPRALKEEPWAKQYECNCHLSRLDTNNPAEPLRIESVALLPHFQLRIDVNDIQRTMEYPNRAL